MSNSSLHQKNKSDSFINDINRIINENSFDLKSIENNDDNQEENEIKRPYLDKEEIPKIQIIKIMNENFIKCGEETYKLNKYIEKINEYIEKIEDPGGDSIDLLNDEKYNICKICKEKENKYFCENCNINICDNCHKICKEKKHNIINLIEMIVAVDKNIEIIKKYFK